MKTYPDPWPATELEDMAERMEEILASCEEEGLNAVMHKLMEAHGPLLNAAEAARQYADGTLTPRPPA